MAANAYYLDGGFLLDKSSAMPIRMEDGYLVLHKTEVGGQGKILLSRVDTSGRALWTFNTELKEWANYIFAGKRLVVAGTTNPELSSSDCNLLWSIDLATGKSARYDFFEDR